MSKNIILTDNGMEVFKITSSLIDEGIYGAVISNTEILASRKDNNKSNLVVTYNVLVDDENKTIEKKEYLPLDEDNPRLERFFEAYNKVYKVGKTFDISTLVGVPVLLEFNKSITKSGIYNNILMHDFDVEFDEDVDSE